MAENPYVNKVVFGNDTLVDLTEDSVTANTLLEGETAHSASGEPITGTAKQGHIIWNAIKTALSPQRLKLWFADAKVTDDSTEQATKVEVVQLIDDESELTNAPDGVYQGDYEDAPEDVLDASMVAYNDGSVEDALDDLQVDSETLEAGVNIHRIGKMRILYIGGTFTVSVGSIGISALPNKDRPSQNILGEVGTAILSSKDYPFSINLKTDGTMTGFALDVTQTGGYKYLTGSPQIYATFTYTVN